MSMVGVMLLESMSRRQNYYCLQDLGLVHLGDEQEIPISMLCSKLGVISNTQGIRKGIPLPLRVCSGGNQDQRPASSGQTPE